MQVGLVWNWREGRRAPVFRLNDERRLAVGLVLPAAVVPEGASGVDRAGHAIGVGLLGLGVLRIVQHRAVAELVRPFAGDAERGIARPHARDVRIAPVRLGLDEPFDGRRQLRRNLPGDIALPLPGRRHGSTRRRDGHGSQGDSS
jgi:hypothetical protein